MIAIGVERNCCRTDFDFATAPMLVDDAADVDEVKTGFPLAQRHNMDTMARLGMDMEL